MANMDVKSFANADEVKNPDKTLAQIINFGDVKITKLELEPGWKWSECIKPVVGTESCQAGHVGVVTHGKMKAIHNVYSCRTKYAHPCTSKGTQNMTWGQLK